MIHPDDQARVRAAWDSHIESREIFDLEYRLRRADGNYRVMLARSVSIRAPDGALTRWVGTATDITPRVENEQALRDSHEETVEILESISDAFYAVDNDFRFTYVNGLAESWWGICREDLIGKHVWTLFSHAVGSETYEAQVRALRDRCSLRYETRSPLSGRLIEVNIHPTAVGISVYSRDITDRRALEAQQQAQLLEAEDRANRDSLTNLLNHRAFHDRLCAQADRPENQSAGIAIVLLDLDNFKFFNETYGHAAGDQVLCHVADVLRTCFRSSDILGRIGGDEFAVLAPGADHDETTLIVERARHIVAHAGFRPPGAALAIPLAISYGIAIWPIHGTVVSESVAHADEQLRQAKRREVTGDMEQVRQRLREDVPGFAMLDGLVTAVDDKDRFTRAHAHGVMTLSVAAARALGLSEGEIERIRVAALLKDIGKIGVADAVLRRPGPLSAAEYEVIKQHPATGEAIMGAVPELRDIMPAVRHHHERWDGNGFPDGLVGLAIPLAARIIAVADAYSAMTADRPYRRRMSDDDARGALERGAGNQWDPAIVAIIASIVRG